MVHIEPLIAHRGASPYAPENTIAAFDKARELGARAIELDIMISADGELFVLHDETLERTTNGRGKIGSVSSDYIATLDAGSWFSEQFSGEKVPKLSETLLWFAEHKLQANIEIKPPAGCAKKTVDAFVACINRYWPPELVLPLVSSFNADVLRLCAQLLPELPLGLLYCKWQPDWQDLAKEVHATSVHLNQCLFTRKRMQAIQSAGYKTCVYTVNSRRKASRYFDWGADSVLTDYPDLMER